MAKDTASTPDLVSVIVPACNAAATIDETLRSVRAQTYTALEILIIDDGSTDATAKIAGDHARQDSRVRLLRQANGGVARARNFGIAQARGAFIAPVDADDLWRPRKIEKQMQAIKRGGEKFGLAYAWTALIDENSNVFDETAPPLLEGDVLQAIYAKDIIGNGSSPLMRRSVLLEAGGYDPSLRDAEAQGCEDRLLYTRIANKYHFAVVPEFMVGYRQTPSNMSSDGMQMIRSWGRIIEELRTMNPQFEGELNTAECSLYYWLYMRSCRARQLGRACSVLAHITRTHPLMAFKVLMASLGEGAVYCIREPARAMGLWRKADKRYPFLDDATVPASARETSSAHGLA